MRKLDAAAILFRLAPDWHERHHDRSCIHASNRLGRNDLARLPVRRRAVKVVQSPSASGLSAIEHDGSGFDRIAELDVARLIERHRRLRILCTQAEVCADGLPASPDAEMAGTFVQNLTTVLADDFGQEQHFMLESFGHDQHSVLVRVLLQQIAGRFTVVVDRAADVAAAFDPVAVDLRPPSHGTRGYMLQSFFESCRDTLWFVELVILALGQKRLTTLARDMLIAGLA